MSTCLAPAPLPRASPPCTPSSGWRASAWSHGGGLDSLGCHKKSSDGTYHCHQGLPFLFDKKAFGEDFFNLSLAGKLGGQTEVTFDYEYAKFGNTKLVGSIRVDVVTDDYVIEGGLDKRSSLDSIQQAVFASTIADRKPAVAIYDTDGVWGKYEHRSWFAAKELGVRFIWFKDFEAIDVDPNAADPATGTKL